MLWTYNTGKEGLYKDGIYTDAGGLGEESEVACHFLLPDIVAEVVAHLNHVHLEHEGFHLFEQCNADPEDCPPSVHQEDIEDLRELIERQETGEDCHDPLGCEVVSRHLRLPQMREELRHVKLDQLRHLEVLQMKLWHSLSE